VGSGYIVILLPECDLRGYTEMKDGERVHEEGMLESFGLSEEEATMLIMQARVKAGWIDESALYPEPEEELDEEGNSVPTAESVFETEGA